MFYSFKCFTKGRKKQTGFKKGNNSNNKYFTKIVNNKIESELLVNEAPKLVHLLLLLYGLQITFILT